MADGREVAEFEAVAKMLGTIRSSNEETLKAVKALQHMLHSSTVQRKKKLLTALKKEVLARRLHNNLGGILRSNSKDEEYVCSVATCIALLAHECDEMKDAFEEKGLVREFLSFLKPTHPLYPGLHLDERIAPSAHEKKASSSFKHIEAVLLALQKLLYMHRNSNSCFINHDGIGYVLQLCQKLQAMRCEFSDQAAAMLFDLTSGQGITAVMEKMEGKVFEYHKSAFKAFTESQGSIFPLCDLYHVELHSPQGSVADVMIKEGVAWVGSHSRDQIEGVGEECEVCITHVETGGHFWCQRYGGEDASRLPAMYASLKNMPCPVTDSSLVAMAAPQLGSVHAVYFDPTEEEGPREWTTPTHPTWLRGRVIASRYSDSHQQEVVVLAIDYGFVFIASMTKLRPLPHACQGIIHQAVPCVLAGVCPVPQHLNVLRRAAGVLCNVCSLGHKGQIVFFLHQGSVELLKTMASSADHELVRCSLATLANLSQGKDQKHKEELRKLGALHFALECCEAFTDQEDLLRLSLKCLQGMLFESVPNRVRVIEMGGITVLSKLRETEALSCLHEAVDFVLANIMGDVCLSPMSELSVADMQKNPTIQGPDRKSITDLLKRSSTSLKAADHSSVKPQADPLPAASKGLNGQMDCGKCPVSALQAGTHYSKGQLLHYDDLEQHEFICCEDLQALHSQNLQNHICAFLNSYTGGVIHIGVTSNGAIRGIPLNRHEVQCLFQLKEGKRHKRKVQRSGPTTSASQYGMQQQHTTTTTFTTDQIGPTQPDAAITATCVDQFSAAVDAMLITRIKPFINPSLYKVTFVPVAMEMGKPLFVIELSFVPGELQTVYAVKEASDRQSCYIRVKGKTSKVSYMQQLREFVIAEEERKQRRLNQNITLN